MNLIYAIGETNSSYLNYCLIKKNILNIFPNWKIYGFGLVNNKKSYFNLNENINWCQEALLNNPGGRTTCKALLGSYYFLFNINKLELLINQIEIFQPDLIINDMNYPMACIANTMQIPTWYVSPLLDLNAAEGSIFKTGKKYIKNFPLVNNYLSYHAFGDIKPYTLNIDKNNFSCCFIDNNFNKINKLINSNNELTKKCFINSSSFLIQNLIENDGDFIINQHLNNYEDQLNYYLLKNKIEFINNFENCNQEKLNLINKFKNNNNNNNNYIKNNKKYLHQHLENYEINSI